MLISCIMPTRGRQGFAAISLAMFEAQTWPKRELVILDDRDAPSFPSPPHAPSIVYHRLDRRMLIGAKRNLACSRSAGEIICHWDDDDVSAPGRLEDQAYRLIKANAQVTGYHSMIFRNHVEAWEYRSMEVPYAIGSSLMYLRDFWKRNPFPDYRIAEDESFTRAAKRDGVLVSADANGMMEASVHPGNTSQRVFIGKTWRKMCA